MEPRRPGPRPAAPEVTAGPGAGEGGGRRSAPAGGEGGREGSYRGMKLRGARPPAPLRQVSCAPCPRNGAAGARGLQSVPGVVVSSPPPRPGSGDGSVIASPRWCLEPRAGRAEALDGDDGCAVARGMAERGCPGPRRVPIVIQGRGFAAPVLGLAQP